MGKRGRKPSKDKKGYFLDEQEEAVVRYINSTDQNERNKIYKTILHPAFCKMVESIMNRYKLYVPDEEFLDTFDDTISFLMTKIELFNPNSGYKAYSYCGTICKNYLILKIKNYAKGIKRYEPYENYQSKIEDNITLSYKDNDSSTSFFNELITNTSSGITEVMSKNKKLNENEIKVGNALLSLLANWEDLADSMCSNKFNKSSILLFLKENTQLTTKDIRVAMKKYKAVYFSVKKKLLGENL